MSGPVKSMPQLMRDLWAAVVSPSSSSAQPVAPVIVHDPEANLPHDLDDPFFDRNVQSRMAVVIAQTGKKTDGA